MKKFFALCVAFLMLFTQCVWASVSDVDGYPKFPSTGRKHYAIYREATRDNRVEAAFFNITDAKMSDYLVYDGNALLLADNDRFSDCVKYALIGEEWVEFEEGYPAISNYASEVLGSDLPIVYTNSEVKYALKHPRTVTIDYTPIECWIVNGDTYISVADLAYYGFNVSYDAETATYNVTRERYATPMYTKELWERNASLQTRTEIQPTVVKVLLDGNATEVVGIEGKSLISVDALSPYGEVHWDEQGDEVTVRIFKPELEADLKNAENVVEREYVYEDQTYTYKGQVNAEDLPHGIGNLELKSTNATKIFFGYFEEGCPSGALYKHFLQRVDKYESRYDYFIGRVGKDKETGTTAITNTNGQEKQDATPALRFSAFGIPLYSKNRSFPTHVRDLEYIQGVYIMSHTVMHHGYSVKNEVWYDGKGLQTLREKSSESWYSSYEIMGIEKLRNPEITNFIEYTNEKATYYNNAVAAVSGTGTMDNPIALNDPSVGGGVRPLIITVLVNGEDVEFTYPARPFIQDGRTLVPARAVFEKMGAEVLWEEDTQKVVVGKGNTLIEVQIDNPIMMVNGQEILLDVPPMIKKDRTYIPLRAIAEGLNATVSWDEGLKVVSITNE